MSIAATLLAALLAVAPTTPIQRLARELFDNFNAGRFDAASRDFADSLRGVVTPAVLADVRKQVHDEAGEFRSVTDIRERRSGPARIVDMTLRYDKAPVMMEVVFDLHDRVSKVNINAVKPTKPDPALEASARALFAAFIANDFEKAGKDFNATMRAQLTPARLAELRENVTNAYGSFLRAREARQRSEQGYRIVDLMTVWVNANNIAVSVVFDAEGRVGGLRIGKLNVND